MSRTTPRKGGPGRKPAGKDGDLSSTYPMLAVRLPPGTKAVLKALALRHGEPLWRVVDAAVAEYVMGLPADERKLIQQIAKVRA